jgi:hypothetical protein
MLISAIAFTYWVSIFKFRIGPEEFIWRIFVKWKTDLTSGEKLFR